MLKSSLLFKKEQTFRVKKSRIPGTKNTKFSEYYFYLNTNMYEDFQICISVPLNMRYIFLSILVFDSFNLLDLRAVNHILCKKLVLLTKVSLLMNSSPFFMFCLNFEPRVNHYMFRRKKLRLISINILKLD